MGFLAACRSRLVHWVFPQTCCACKEDLPHGHPHPLCPACVQELRIAEPPYCERCGDPIPPSCARCGPCAKRLFACEAIRPVFFYGGAAACLVHAFKYRHRVDAARFCGKRMSGALPRLPELWGFDCLVPVPLHRSRLRERGYNQARLLALEVAATSRKPVEELLVRRHATKPQWNLGRGERGKNVSGGIVAGPGEAEGRKVLLIDDVCTTSATLEECAKALRSAGADSVKALVLARQTLKG
ncbi:MAG: ComF family protein [Elusimicrobia bacterium]|nr:ComF family protein [Elusimicrobiota bacterium]